MIVGVGFLVLGFRALRFWVLVCRFVLQKGMLCAVFYLDEKQLLFFLLFARPFVRKF